MVVGMYDFLACATHPIHRILASQPNQSKIVLATLPATDDAIVLPMQTDMYPRYNSHFCIAFRKASVRFSRRKADEKRKKDGEKASSGRSVEDDEKMLVCEKYLQ